jgi:hypothetical protein
MCTIDWATSAQISSGRVLALIGQCLRHVIYDDGLYRDVRRGPARGCRLSPLLGALYLPALDERLERLGLFYTHFMGTVHFTADSAGARPSRTLARAAQSDQGGQPDPGRLKLPNDGTAQPLVFGYELHLHHPIFPLRGAE